MSFNDNFITGEGAAKRIWVYNPRDDTISEGVCTAYELFLSEVSSFEAINEQCDARLSYICTKPAESVGKNFAADCYINDKKVFGVCIDLFVYK